MPKYLAKFTFSTNIVNAFATIRTFEDHWWGSIQQIAGQKQWRIKTEQSTKKIVFSFVFKKLRLFIYRSAAAIFNGISEAANFAARHNPAKKSSFSHIRWPPFSPQQSVKKNSAEVSRAVRSPSPHSQPSLVLPFISLFPLSFSQYTMVQMPKSARISHQTESFGLTKRFSFALNRKRWFSTSTSAYSEYNGRSDCSRRTSTSELPSVVLSVAKTEKCKKNLLAEKGKKIICKLIKNHSRKYK